MALYTKTMFCQMIHKKLPCPLSHEQKSSTFYKLLVIILHYRRSIKMPRRKRLFPA